MAPERRHVVHGLERELHGDSISHCAQRRNNGRQRPVLMGRELCWRLLLQSVPHSRATSLLWHSCARPSWQSLVMALLCTAVLAAAAMKGKAAPESLEQQLMRSPQLLAALRRGAAATGDSSRLLRVLRDAKAGRAVQLVGVGASLTGDYAGVIGRDQVERFLPHLLRPHLLRPHLLRASPPPPSPANLAASLPSPSLSPPRLSPPHHTG